MNWAEDIDFAHLLFQLNSDSPPYHVAEFLQCIFL